MYCSNQNLANITQPIGSVQSILAGNIVMKCGKYDTCTSAGTCNEEESKQFIFQNTF